jgi:hypothetical protein
LRAEGLRYREIGTIGGMYVAGRGVHLFDAFPGTL